MSFYYMPNKVLYKKGTILLLVLCLACSCKPTFNIQTENIGIISRSTYGSFKFFNPNNMPASNFAFSDTNKKRIFDAVAEEMKLRSFTSRQEADLIIKIQGGTSQEIEKNSPTFYDPYYSRNNMPYYWSRDPYLNDDISRKTTMIIVDIFDAKTNKLLWQGTGSGVLSDKEDKVPENIRKAISDIFLEFPVTPGN